MVAAHFKRLPEAKAAMDKYRDLTNVEYMKAVDNLPFDELGSEVGRITKQNVEFRPSEKDPEKADVYVHDRLVHSNYSRQDIKDQLMQNFAQNPKEAYEAAVAADNRTFARAKDVATMKLAAAQADHLQEQVKQMQAKGPIETATEKAKLDELTGNIDFRKSLGDPRNFELYPDKVYAGMQKYGGDKKDGTIWKANPVFDENTGKTSTTYTNLVEEQLAKAQQRMQASPYKAYIGIETVGDDRHFVIKDPNTGKPTGNYPSFHAAELDAAKLYKTAAPAAAAEPRSPGAAQVGRTVARTPMRGIGVGPNGQAIPIPASP
jgi:hypothetical protein